MSEILQPIFFSWNWVCPIYFLKKMRILLRLLSTTIKKLTVTINFRVVELSNSQVDVQFSTKQVRRCSKITWPREPWASEIPETKTQNQSTFYSSWHSIENLLNTPYEHPKVPLRTAWEHSKILKLTSWHPVENLLRILWEPLENLLKTS